MGLSKIILNIALWFVNVFTFFIKQDSNRITFISLTQDHLDNDFYLINQELKKENKYKIDYNLIVFEKNAKGDFKYFLNCLKQLVEMKKSKLIILNDNNYVVSTHKPKNTKVLQVWHAPGAVKKFGNQIKRQYPVNNYDYVICNAPYWKEPYSEAFGVREDQVYVTGFCRMDLLLNEEIQSKNCEAFYKKYPQCVNKRLILYTPTFRGNIINGFKIDSIDFNQLDLDDNTILLCKYHPLLQEIQIDNEKVINVTKDDLYTLMSVSDCMISDYSSVIFDYALINKPMIGFVQDYENYKETIGFNIDFKKDFPGPICTNEQELNKVLKQDLKVYPSFQKKYVVYKDGKNTLRVKNLIDQIMKSE